MQALEKLLAIMAQLRDPQQGCPWDREQTFATIAPYTIEEAYEVADAIAQGEVNEIREELGDLLFQVVFYAQMGKEAGHFDFEDIAATAAAKLIRRHPHVFGTAQISSAEQQHQAWEQHKEAERKLKGGAEASILDGVAVTLPAQTRAVKLQKRAGRVGFDWNNPYRVLEKIMEELDEVRAELDAGADPKRMLHEIGDVLFACANLARHVDVDPESALRLANQRFERRFKRIEALLRERGLRPEQASLEEMENLWQQAKREEQADEGR